MITSSRQSNAGERSVARPGLQPEGHVKRAQDRGETSRDAILNVAERLFAARGFANVSVRDIAEKAGVTHPLIYYHWRSKRELLAAVLGRNQERMRAVARAGGDPRGEVLRLVEESATGSRTYMLTLARAFLDGMLPGEWPGGFPGVESALWLLGAGPADAPAGGRDADADETRRLVALAVGLLFGWILFEDQLLEMAGLGAGDREAARRTLLAAEEAVLGPAFARVAGQTDGRGRLDVRSEAEGKED